MFGEHLRAFHAGLSAATGFLESPPPAGTYSIAKIRVRHPRAYEPWSPDEDARLLCMHRQSAPIAVLAAEFQRQPSAIRSRLAKLTGHRPSTPPQSAPPPPPGPIPDRLPDAITYLVRTMPGRLTRTSLARILVGSPAASAQRHSGHALFGRFGQLSRREVVAETGRLAETGAIRILDKRLYLGEQGTPN